MEANCWVWNPDPVILPIWGPLQIRWYGLCFLGVFYFGWVFLHWQMKRGGRGDRAAGRFVNWAVVGVLVGSWIVHRVFYEWDRVLADPFYLIDVRRGLAGLASHGGTLGLVTALYLFGRKYGIPFGEMVDRMCFGGAFSAVMVRLGNFFNSEIVGVPSDVPWAVCLPRYDKLPADSPDLVPRHPSQLYEVAIGAGVVLLLVIVDRWAGKERRPRWLISGVFFSTFFAARFGVELLKEHQTMAPATALTMGQWLSIPFVLAGLAMLWYALAKRLPAGAASPPDPAPVDPAPVDPASVDPTPVNPAPVNPAMAEHRRGSEGPDAGEDPGRRKKRKKRKR